MGVPWVPTEAFLPFLNPPVISQSKDEVCVGEENLWGEQHAFRVCSLQRGGVTPHSARPKGLRVLQLRPHTYKEVHLPFTL